MYNIEIKAVMDKLKTSSNGLSDAEAMNRLKINGKNFVEKFKKQSFLMCFVKQFLNIMVGILLVSAIISITIALVEKNYSDLFEGFVILFIVLMNALLGVYQEYKAQACILELQKYEKRKVNVYRNNKLIKIDSGEIVCGDIVEMEAGEIVPADIRLISVNNFACDESSLTGESISSEKSADIISNKHIPLAERKNMAYSGSLITAGKAQGVVVATGKNTELGKIAKMLYDAKKEQTPLQKSINKIGKIITWAVVTVSVLILIAELIAGKSIMNSLMVSVSLAVAAIPESLPAVITIIMALGVQQLAKRKCIIRHLHAVETLGSCQIICSDKTGTLTQNKMQVVDIFSSGRHLTETKKVDDDLLKCLYLCNNARIEKNKAIGEPTETALLEFVKDKIQFLNKNIIHEIPFSSERKMMTVLVDDNGLTSYTKGAPEIILEKCKYIKINNEIVSLTEEMKDKLKKENELMTAKALRVIGAGCKRFSDGNNENFEDGLTFLGFVGMMDNPRPEVKESISKCFKAGLIPIMITGDHKSTAFAIAEQIGLATDMSQVITGEELDKMSEKELKKRCCDFRVYARVSPEHKVRIVKAFKSINRIVAMTGDGVNDAPSLKIADIGVGMGKSGTDVVKSVADMLVTDDNFSSIVVAVEEGRKVYANIQKALQFLISTNCVEVFGMLIALLIFPQYTFLIPSQMLFVNLVSDSLPAFALGTENVEREMMLSPPRNPKAGLFSGSVGIAIIYQSILQTAIAITVFLVGVFCYSPKVASTMVFFTIIFMQLLHSVNCKTNSSLFEKKLLDNKTFNVCFLITLGLNLTVACVPFMYKLFGLEFLNLSQWIIVVIASIIIIPACELVKAILSKSENNFKNSKNIKKINNNKPKLKKIIENN